MYPISQRTKLSGLSSFTYRLLSLNPPLLYCLKKKSLASIKQSRWYPTVLSDVFFATVANHMHFVTCAWHDWTTHCQAYWLARCQTLQNDLVWYGPVSLIRLQKKKNSSPLTKFLSVSRLMGRAIPSVWMTFWLRLTDYPSRLEHEHSWMVVWIYFMCILLLMWWSITIIMLWPHTQFGNI